MDIPTIYVFHVSTHNNSKTSKAVITIIDYSPLWETMKNKGISQYYLLQHGIDNKTLDSIKKGNNITLLTLEKLCDILDCTPNDIVKFTEK